MDKKEGLPFFRKALYNVFWLQLAEYQPELLIDLIPKSQVDHTTTHRSPYEGGIKERTKGLFRVDDRILLKIIGQVFSTQVKIDRVFFAKCFTQLCIHDPERRWIGRPLINGRVTKGRWQSFSAIQD